MVRQSQANKGITAHLLIHGRVQGVGYRFFVQEQAETLGLSGWVRNLPDGNVEVSVEGSRAIIELMIEKLKIGPTMARVDSVSVDWQPAQGHLAGFSITG
jgi:acylphosphatase